MKFLTPTLHGLGDYAAAFVLIIAPFLLDLAQQSVIAHWFSVAGGVGLVLYSLLTDYHFSIARMLPFDVHLLLDGFAAAALLGLPFVLGLEGIAQLYFLVMGGGVILVVAVSQRDTPARETAS
ncbi:MAG: hypothetical protein V2I66_02385 [Halieaceae bacterium]|jgi:hypothetical protein|nr:hypothetical protein [Halieaceae bacterium]